MLAALVLIAHLDRTLPLSHVGRQPAFSPDSKLLAASSADGVVKLMQLPDRKVVKILRDSGGVTASPTENPCRRSPITTTTRRMWHSVLTGSGSSAQARTRRRSCIG